MTNARKNAFDQLVAIYSQPSNPIGFSFLFSDSESVDHSIELATRMCEYVYEGKSDEQFVDGQHVEGSLYPAGDFEFRASHANHILSERGSNQIAW